MHPHSPPTGTPPRSSPLESLERALATVPRTRLFGRVSSVRGEAITLSAPQAMRRVGATVRIEGAAASAVYGEVVAFDSSGATVLPFGPIEGVHEGCLVHLESEAACIHPDHSWCGRVLDCHGQPIDGCGPLIRGARAYRIHAPPPPAHERMRIGAPLPLGIRAIDAFLTCCEGQRMGIFAGSGVGKTMLLSALARGAGCDVTVIGFIGERGREMREFISDHQGSTGLSRSVIITSTSDESALRRRKAAQITLSVAEYFRDHGARVLCLMDSVTRIAQAQREIGLAGREPPATKGYPPSVFSLLPRLLERAGPGCAGQGTITGLFTVLVEGDDMADPVADCVRSVLDGHIILDRSIAERGRFPAINILKSVSRTMPGCLSAPRAEAAVAARRLLARYGDMEELIRLGAYRTGSDALVDEAVRVMPALEAFLSQAPGETTDFAMGHAMLSQLLSSRGQSGPNSGESAATT